MNNSPVFTAVISTAPSESNPPVAGNVLARTSDSPPSSVPFSSVIVRTSSAATAPS